MKGIRHIGSRDRHFTSSLPGDRYLITGPKSRRTSFGTKLWHHLSCISSRVRSSLPLKFLPYPREKYPLKLNKISTAFSTHSPHDNSFLRFKYPLVNEKVSRLSELNSLYTKSWHNHSGSSMKYHHLISFVIAFGRDNFLELDVYFEEMQVTLITQRQAYDQESLFGECDLRCMQTDSH